MRDLLRSATRESHDQLDQTIDRLRLLEDRRGYRAYLRAMHRLYSQYGTSLDRVSQRLTLQPHVPQLLACLSDDFGSELGGTWQENPVDCPEAMWAAAYVLEGAALGARRVLETVRDRVDERGNPFPHRFLTRLAEEASIRWPAVVDGLNGCGCDPDLTATHALRVFQTAGQILKWSAGLEGSGRQLESTHEP